MSLALMYYLITLIGGLNAVIGLLLLISGGILGVTLFFWACASDNGNEEEAESLMKSVKKSGLVILVTLPLFVLMPSKKDAIIIAGLGLGEKGVTKVSEEAGEFYPMLKKVLKKELTELAEDKEE